MQTTRSLTRAARPLLGTLAAAAVSLSLAACGDRSQNEPTGAVSALKTSPSPRFRYGPAKAVGNGQARTYVLLDETLSHPIEVGIALDAEAMDNLPAPMPMDSTTNSGGMGGHGMMTEYQLKLPAGHGTPYQFVEMDWNPAGHEPPGIYDIPHFDFHFYTITEAVRNSINPADPQYFAKAAKLPPREFVAPFYVDAATAAGAPAGAVSVPRMGLHWLDVRSPELQGALGNPAGYRPFTKTFLHGSWNGQVTFDEPMITRAYIMAKKGASDPAVRNEIVPISTGEHRAPAGWYPNAYRVGYDAGANEYRIAMTNLSWQQ